MRAPVPSGIPQGSEWNARRGWIVKLTPEMKAKILKAGCRTHGALALSRQPT
jgi:hypothetical protein